MVVLGLAGHALHISEGLKAFLSRHDSGGVAREHGHIEIGVGG